MTTSWEFLNTHLRPHGSFKTARSTSIERKNFSRENPHVDVVFALTPPLISNHRQGCYLLFQPLSLPTLCVQVASCSYLLKSGAVLVKATINVWASLKIIILQVNLFSYIVFVTLCGKQIRFLCILLLVYKKLCYFISNYTLMYMECEPIVNYCNGWEVSYIPLHVLDPLPISAYIIYQNNNIAKH
jgi:hypothetical protein